MLLCYRVDSVSLYELQRGVQLRLIVSFGCALLRRTEGAELTLLYFTPLLRFPVFIRSNRFR